MNLKYQIIHDSIFSKYYKSESVMSSFHPYFRHTALLIVLISFLILAIVIFRKCFKDEKFRMFLLASISVDNNVSKGSSGKALTGLFFSIIIALASIVSFIWNPTHQMPEYMFLGLLAFIASLYGIKTFGGKYSNSGGNDNGNNDNNGKVSDGGATGITGGTGTGA